MDGSAAVREQRFDGDRSQALASQRERLEHEFCVVLFAHPGYDEVLEFWRKVANGGHRWYCCDEGDG